MLSSIFIFQFPYAVVDSATAIAAIVVGVINLDIFYKWILIVKTRVFWLGSIFPDTSAPFERWYFLLCNLVMFWINSLLYFRKMPPKKATRSKENSSSFAEGPSINKILDLLRQQQQQLQLIQQI